MDLLEKYKTEFDYTAFDKLRQANKVELSREHWQKYHDLLKELSTFKLASSQWFSKQSDPKIIELALDPNFTKQELLKELIQVLIPWRKGPFKILDNFIDSEWQCWMKWLRLESALPNLAGKKIADVGSGNGYFMFQLAKQRPELVMGFERSTSAFHQFKFLQSIAKDPSLHMDFVDSEALPFFKSFFDVVLCMGVVYHTRNPLLLLDQIKTSLKPGGVAFIESQIWPGEESFCFFNEDRYSKVKNVFFVPTLTALQAWIARSGFKNIKIVSVDKTTVEEQRKTAYAPFESLQDFLDPNNLDLTIEGHPAPVRALIKAEKT